MTKNNLPKKKVCSRCGVQFSCTYAKGTNYNCAISFEEGKTVTTCSCPTCILGNSDLSAVDEALEHCFCIFKGTPEYMLVHALVGRMPRKEDDKP